MEADTIASSRPCHTAGRGLCLSMRVIAPTSTFEADDQDLVLSGARRFIVSGMTSQAWGGDLAEGRVAAERLLGSDGEAAQPAKAICPSTAPSGASGVVAGSLEASAAAAGVQRPPCSRPCGHLAPQSTSSAIQGRRSFLCVRYEQTFTIEDRPIGIGRVLWAELRTAAKGARSPFIASGRPRTNTEASGWPADRRRRHLRSSCRSRRYPSRRASACAPTRWTSPPCAFPWGRWDRRPSCQSLSVEPKPGSPILKPSPLGSGERGERRNAAPVRRSGSPRRMASDHDTSSSSSSSSSLSSSSRGSWVMHQGRSGLPPPARRSSRRGGIVLVQRPMAAMATGSRSSMTAISPRSTATLGLRAGHRAGRARVPGRGDRLFRQYRPLDRPASAFRGLDQRPAGKSDRPSCRQAGAQLRGPDLERFRRHVASDLQVREREVGPL